MGAISSFSKIIAISHLLFTSYILISEPHRMYVQIEKNIQEIQLLNFSEKLLVIQILGSILALNGIIFLFDKTITKVFFSFLYLSLGYFNYSPHTSEWILDLALVIIFGFIIRGGKEVNPFQDRQYEWINEIGNCKKISRD